MTRKHTLLAGLLASLSAISITAAMAASPDTGCAGGHAGMAGHGRSDMGAMAQQRLTQLKSDLKLTAAQDNAWQSFASQMTQRIASRQAARQTHTPPTGTAPERMGQHIEMMKQRLADMSADQAALQDLYSVLSTAQRAVVDQHIARMGSPGQEGRGLGQ
jgi:Spy/CpxP family protein refolding chaperone